MYNVIMTTDHNTLSFLSLHSSTLGQFFLSVLEDDDDLGAKLCCSAMGRGHETRSPTVTVSQLPETHRAIRQSDGHAQRDAVLHRPAGREPEQATPSCAG